jgi:hypothetical protein
MQRTGSWANELNGAAAAAERELQQLIAHFNDRVVPEIRTHGRTAMHKAAHGLRSLADRLDERKRAERA